MLERARANASACGVAERVEFHCAVLDDGDALGASPPVHARLSIGHRRRHAQRTCIDVPVLVSNRLDESFPMVRATMPNGCLDICLLTLSVHMPIPCGVAERVEFHCAVLDDGDALGVSYNYYVVLLIRRLS